MAPDPRNDGPGSGQSDAGLVAETARSFAMLLGTDDLPGRGWAVAEERSWPTGRLDPASGKSRRALLDGSITAWRKFAGAQPSASAWVEVVPYACAEDARLSLAQVPRFFVGVALPDETVVDEHVVDDRVVPGVRQPWAYQRSSSGPRGDVLARTVAGAVDRDLFLVCLSGAPDSWAWDEVLGIASAQAEQVRRARTA
jgi:hypothetical protein